jgi:hypothetical protein
MLEAALSLEPSRMPGKLAALIDTAGFDAGYAYNLFF